VIAPAYISEIAPANIRGRLTSIQQIAIISGLFIAFLSNYFVAGVAGGSTSIFLMGFEAWRWMFWIELVPASIFFITLLFIPESPRFVVLRGDENVARATLTKLYGANQAEKTIAEIQASFNADNKPRFSDLFDKLTNKVKPIIWVGIGFLAL